MQSKTMIALGALLTAAILAFFTLRAPEKGERTGPKARPIAALQAADVKELSLSSGGGKDQVTLKLVDGTWRVTAPADYPADQSLVKTAVEQLEKLEWGDVVTERKESFGGLEVAEDKGAHVIAKDSGGKVLFDAWIGKSSSGFTMVRPVGKDAVWQATGLYKYTYAREAKAFRDHQIFSFNKDDATRLAVESAGQKIVLDRLPAPPAEKDKPTPPQEDHWKVVESTVKVDPLDDAVANQMLMALASLSAADFDDATKPEAAGTTTPRFRITVTTKSGPLELLVGNPKGDDIWVQVGGKQQIYSMHKYAMDRLTQKPIDFRDKTIVKAKEDDLVGLEIVNGDERISLEHDQGTWKMGKGGKGTLDDAKVKGVVTAFEDLKGASFAEPSANTVLAKPAGVVTLRLRDKSEVVLKIGGARDGQEYYVQKAGSPDVLLIKKYQVDRFWKKLADLTQADSTKAAAPMK